MATNDTTLLMKLPTELKGAFKGLCDSRGVTMTEELRRFMADEVSKSVQGMTTEDRPVRHNARKPSKAVETLERCKDTIDMFDGVKTADKAQSAINAHNKRKKKR